MKVEKIRKTEQQNAAHPICVYSKEKQNAEELMLNQQGRINEQPDGLLEYGILHTRHRPDRALRPDNKKTPSMLPRYHTDLTTNSCIDEPVCIFLEHLRSGGRREL